VVKDDSVVEKSELGVWKVQVVLCFFWEFFPVADCVVRKVSNCASCEPELPVGNCPVFNEFLDYFERIVAFLMDFFASLFIAGYCVSIFYLCG
jgi:hypothetical protein